MAYYKEILRQVKATYLASVVDKVTRLARLEDQEIAWPARKKRYPMIGRHPLTKYEPQIIGSFEILEDVFDSSPVDGTKIRIVASNL